MRSQVGPILDPSGRQMYGTWGLGAKMLSWRVDNAVVIGELDQLYSGRIAASAV
jgi:hypothetical protein